VSYVRRFGWLIALVVIATTVYVVRVDNMMVDYAVYDTAADRVVDAEDLYRDEDGHYQYKYFPLFAFAMVPFAALSPETGEVVWFVLSIAMVVVFVRWCVAALPSPRLTRRALTWLAVLLVGRFYAREVALGQTNALLGVLLIAALIASQRQRVYACAALIGAAVFVKPYALIFIPWLLVAHGAAATAVCGAVLAAGLLLPALVYGWSGNLALLADWWHTVTNTTQPNLFVPENVSIASMWARWVGAGETATLLTGVTLAVIGIVIAVVMLRRRGIGEPSYLEFGLLMLVIPIASPQGWDYVLMLGTPVVLCLVDRMPSMPIPWRVIGWAGVLIMSFTIFDLVGRTIYTTFMAISMITVAALLQLSTITRLRLQRLA
jgi:hypothetical protein